MSMTESADTLEPTGTRPRYDEYEDSGVEWLGEIPSHWTTAELKYCVQSLVSGGTPASTDDEYWASDDEEGVPWVAVGDMSDTSQVDTTEKRVTKEGIEEADLETLSEGTLLYSIYASLGEVSVLDIPATTNQAILGITPDEETVSSNFLYYWLQHMQKHVEVLSSSNTQDNLSAGRVRNMPVYLPESREQRAIAAYLDRETKRIDALIEKKEQLVDLVEEKRTALISRVVTKGLDGDVEMQDSGIGPIGSVPSHWRIKRNKWLYREAEERSETGEEELLTVSHKTGITPRSEKKDVNMIEAESTEGYKICRPGDLVINTMWAWKGALGISSYHGVVSPSYNVYRLREEERERIEPRFLDYLYRVPAYVTEIDRHSVGVWKSRLRLYPEAFFRMKTPLPPIAEQKRVVHKLDREMERRDRLVKKVEDAIEGMKEYRTALISAAVTGQIDVRGEVEL